MHLLLGFPGLSGGFIYLRTQPLSLYLGLLRGGLGWQSIQDSRERARCKALLFGVHKSGRSVGSVQLGSFWAGGRCFVEATCCLLERCCGIVGCGWCRMVGCSLLLSLAFPPALALALAAARRFVCQDIEACKQASNAVVMGIETWRRVRLFALIAVSSPLC